MKQITVMEKYPVFTIEIDKNYRVRIEGYKEIINE